MANVIKLRKGLDLNLKGKAKEELHELKPTGTFAVVPADFQGITPKLLVKEGEAVQAGTALFYDKNYPSIKFVSPISGTIEAINRGERRKVLNITVKPDGKNSYKEFGKMNVAAMSGEEVKNAMLENGTWAFVKQRPYDVVAAPDVTPKAIFVTSFDSAPLAPDFEFVLKGNEADFQTGLDALAKMAKTYLSISSKQSAKALTEAKNVTINIFDGPHPAGNVGVQINHISPINKGETAWTLNAWDVILIGRTFNKGIADFTRTIEVAGSEVKNPSYCKVLMGQPLADILKGRTDESKELRIIRGNVLTGKKAAKSEWLGACENMITVIPEGHDTNEMLGWIMPRLNQFSVSRSYFSWITDPGHKKEYVLDARIKGGERHMIMSHEYDKVLPMDIMPEYLIKAIIAGDIDRMEALGIYEVAPEDFALCEFVCSSKMELQRIVRDGLDLLRKEMA